MQTYQRRERVQAAKIASIDHGDSKVPESSRQVVLTLDGGEKISLTLQQAQRLGAFVGGVYVVPAGKPALMMPESDFAQWYEGV